MEQENLRSVILMILWYQCVGPTPQCEILCEASVIHFWTDKVSDSSRTLQSADKSLARPGRKQATATEDFDVHISYL